MPKNRSKKANKGSKKSGGRLNPPSIESLKLSEHDSAHASYDDDSYSETSSYVTASSDFLADYGAASDGEDDSPETNSVVQLEEKLKDAIDGLTERSAKYRKECLATIAQSFISNDVSSLLERYQETICDNLEKCLKKGSGEEQALAATAISAVAVQMGLDGGQREENSAHGNMFSTYSKFLIKIILDKSASVHARTKCCQGLGVLAFLEIDDMDEVFKCLSTFETIFKDSFLKGDKTAPSVPPLVSDFHSVALSAWTLLISICPWSKVMEIAQNILSKLPELLTSSNVDLRIGAGDTIALFYEIIRCEDAHYLLRRLLDQKKLVADFKELATDSSKSRSKKDKKAQRSNFRDILRSIENDEAPEVAVKFGNEALYIDTWTTKQQYTFFKDLLGTGLNFHLKYNGLMRDIFDLGPVMLDNFSNKKGSHLERHLHNQAIFKARSKIRGKMRDKRTSFMY